MNEIRHIFARTHTQFVLIHFICSRSVFSKNVCTFLSFHCPAAPSRWLQFASLHFRMLMESMKITKSAHSIYTVFFFWLVVICAIYLSLDAVDNMCEYACTEMRYFSFCIASIVLRCVCMRHKLFGTRETVIWVHYMPLILVNIST